MTSRLMFWNYLKKKKEVSYCTHMHRLIEFSDAACWADSAPLLCVCVRDRERNSLQVNWPSDDKNIKTISFSALLGKSIKEYRNEKEGNNSRWWNVWGTLWLSISCQPPVHTCTIDKWKYKPRTPPRWLMLCWRHLSWLPAWVSYLETTGMEKSLKINRTHSLLYRLKGILLSISNHYQMSPYSQIV